MHSSFLKSIVLLEDAINFRSIFHKLDDKTLVVYRLYYSSGLQAILHLNIAVIMLLAFFEEPSSLSASSDITKSASYIVPLQFHCG